jgi:hypothetical protein
MTEYRLQWVQPTPFAGHLVVAETEFEAVSLEAAKHQARHLFATVEKRGAVGIRVLDERGNIAFVFILGASEGQAAEGRKLS